MSKKITERNLLDMTDDETKLIVPHKPPLQLLTGGKLPPGSDWLSQLAQGTTFLSQNRGRVNGVLDMWTIWNKTSSSVLLRTELNQTIFAWVIPKEFCAQNILHEILEQGTDDDATGTEP